ncbi:terminase small subunit [Eubacteriales bacterium OttesenSCG-928-M02]|nr:terminase small subunit [Eubacteriales bacterium OttesenSCG-928-M02]
MARLTDKQKKFVDEYLVDFNATQAAIRAGYSERTATVTASKLLRNPRIQEYLQERQKDLQERTEITQEKVVAEYAKIAFADISDYANVVIDESGATQVQLTATESLTPDQRVAIAGIKQTANGIEVKLYDKQKALEMLGRHLGMFVEKVEHTGNVGLSATIEEIDEYLSGGSG